MEKFRVYGASTPEESQRERDHRALARRAAAEGMVLLKNDGVLPLRTRTVALYGPGSRMTVKGGRGSGDVRERRSVTIEEGLEAAGFSFPTTLWSDRFEEKYRADVAAWRQSVEAACKKYSPIRTMQMFIMIGEHPMPYPACTPILPDELTDETDTAIYVLSRQAGEGDDRRVEKGDYLLSDVEAESLRVLSAHYKKLILVLNCGGVVDLSILDEVRIDAVLFYGQGGMEGGNALADLLTGAATPSGKLADTWACRYEDYPSADTFGHRNGNLKEEDYREGIYIGYRYFSTFGVKPRFPFGYGLSYTSFSQELLACTAEGPRIVCRVRVKNIGTGYAGREVVQLYLRKPTGKLDAEALGLAAFAKTGVLAPGSAEETVLSFDLRDLAGFDESRSCFVLEPGEYGLLLGPSSAGAVPRAVLTVETETVTEYVTPVCPAELSFSDLTGPKSGAGYDPSLPRIAVDLSGVTPIRHGEAPEERAPEKIGPLLSRLTDRDKIALVTGGGYSIRCFNNVMGAAGRTATGLLKEGIPNIVLSDGPAGLNVNQSTVVMKDGTPRYPEGLPQDWRWGWLKRAEGLVKAKPGKGRPVYRYMTAWPSATLQAQSWDTALVEEIGAAIGREMLEIGVSVWLAPGMNLHRNPLCGRNFEYYAEDPLLSGKMAAAVTRGVQSQGGVGVSVKHFCCNNQEDNRTGVSENVSQRAMRELYLRNFRVAVTEGKPWTVMSSYNMVNGVYTPNSGGLCTEVLRREWDFTGLVMSDWNATDQCSHAAAINAGNDLIMPGNKGVRKALLESLKKGELDRAALDRSAARVLKLVFQSRTAEGF